MNDNPSALILAGGYGKRLRPLTWFTPKSLVKVRGIAVVDYAITTLHDAGINEIYINIHHKPVKMFSFLSERSVGMTYEKELLGTAGTIKKLLPFMTDDFVVINADTITTIDIRKMYEYHKKFKNNATFAWKNGKCSGVMIFNKSIYSILPDKGMIDDVFLKNKFHRYYSQENNYWDIGTFEGLKKAREEVR